MTDEEIQREREEAERLIREINATIDRINQLSRENIQLERELEEAIRNVRIMTDNCGEMDRAVYQEMSFLSGRVGEADLSTKHVFDALNELTTQYLAFKQISTASKNVTQFTDEYHTRFSYYNELRRISLGYVVGLDSHMISSENARKKVEKAYLQNTEYWLAYCISAVMLWAGNEPEAAQRAMHKSLSIHYFNACLFYLLINLRFSRIEAAKKWYVNYLDRADMNDLGDEWQYLLQAYLFGAFGSDEAFQNAVAQCFRNMLAQVEVTTVDFAKKFTQKAIEFAELYVHKSELEYTTLRRTCGEYEEMHSLLSTAEKNAEIARYYDALASAEESESEDLPQRIENVLYALVNDYDEDERKVVQKIKYNEAIISARGDIALAQANYDAMFAQQQKKKNLGDLLLSWAFADNSSQADVSVKRFSISFMKEAIAKGFEKFVEGYRTREKEKYTFTIDDCTLVCGEEDYVEAERKLDAHYDKNKLRDTFRDKFVLIYSGMCAFSVLLLLILLANFSPVILTIAILVGLAGSFLLWRRIVDMGRILLEKKRKGKLLMKQALEELAQWRSAYRAADAQSTDMLSAIARF